MARNLLTGAFGPPRPQARTQRAAGSAAGTLPPPEERAAAAGRFEGLDAMVALATRLREVQERLDAALERHDALQRQVEKDSQERAAEAGLAVQARQALAVAQAERATAQARAEGELALERAKTSAAQAQLAQATSTIQGLQQRLAEAIAAAKAPATYPMPIDPPTYEMTVTGTDVNNRPRKVLLSPVKPKAH